MSKRIKSKIISELSTLSEPDNKPISDEEIRDFLASLKIRASSYQGPAIMVQGKVDDSFVNYQEKQPEIKNPDLVKNNLKKI